MNKDFKRRDEIIFGSYEPDKYLGGCRSFSCSYETMKTLVENNFIEMNECQNCSPYTKDFMEILQGVDNVSFEAYAISPDRDDYRVTIEGVDIEIPDWDYGKVCFLVESFHYADEFSFQHFEGVYYLHAWWD